MLLSGLFHASEKTACGRLTSFFLAEAFRPTPVSRERSTAVSPAGPQSKGSSRKHYRSLSVQSPSQRFVEKAVNRSPCNRSRIDFHDCWACGRHASNLWPSSVATAQVRIEQPRSPVRHKHYPRRVRWRCRCDRTGLHLRQRHVHINRSAARCCPRLRSARTRGNGGRRCTFFQEPRDVR